MSHPNRLSSLVLREKIAVCIVITGLLAACAAPAGQPAPAPARPTTAPAAQPTTAPAPKAAPAPARVPVLRLVGGTDWGYPSPFGFNRGPGYTRASYIFDTLAWRDGSGQTIPWLATEWQVSDDQLTWTFTLRDGVKWHDGRPLTVEDVIFSYQYFATTGSGWFLAPLSDVASVTAVGERQVAIKLKRPFAPFLATIAETVFIIPKHIWEKVEDPKKFTGPEAVIGSGPYKLVQYSKEEGAYLYEANDNYFPGKPYVQRLEFIPVSDVALALANRQIDAFDKFGGVTDEMLAPFNKAPYRIGKAPGEWGMNLYFNLSAQSPIADGRVRQAIAYAVDRDALVARLLLGFGEPGSPGGLPPANPFYNPAAQNTYPRDIAKAKALLREAGYPEGQTVEINLIHSTSDNPRLVEMLTAQLAEAGIALKPTPMDQASLDAAAKDGNYDMLLVGFGGLGGDPDQLRRNFASTSKTVGFSRARGYANPEFDKLAGEQVSLLDFAARKAVLDRMQMILAQDLPALPLYYPARVVVYNAEVFDNWYFTPGGYGGGIPLPFNKHQFITGVERGLKIKGAQ
ncbi:MAG: ABC transporter substrate-binding protein [Anaerolineae bacterium]